MKTLSTFYPNQSINLYRIHLESIPKFLLHFKNSYAFTEKSMDSYKDKTNS